MDINGCDTIYVNASGETIDRRPGGDDLTINTIDDIVVEGKSQEEEADPDYLNYLNWLNSHAGNAASIYSANIYAGNRPFIPGYYVNSAGKNIPLTIVNKLPNGKYVRGVQGHRYGINIAKSKVKIPGMIGQGLGFLSFGFALDNYISNQNLSTGIDFAVTGTSVFYWEAGVSYMYVRTVADPNISQMKVNIINNQNSLNNTLNPTTGEYYPAGYFSGFGF
ncbi:MAG: hypothetical protein ACLVKO_08125 [Dysgonomonas sp.]